MTELARELIDCIAAEKIRATLTKTNQGVIERCHPWPFCGNSDVDITILARGHGWRERSQHDHNARCGADLGISLVALNRVPFLSRFPHDDSAVGAIGAIGGGDGAVG